MRWGGPYRIAPEGHSYPEVLTGRLKGAYVRLKPVRQLKKICLLFTCLLIVSFMKEKAGQGYFPFDPEPLPAPGLMKLLLSGRGWPGGSRTGPGRRN
jgi:hypothetical protein